MSDPAMSISRSSLTAAFADSWASRTAAAPPSGIVSQEKRRFMPGAMSSAYIAASIGIVPLPQKGSYSGKDRFQPDRNSAAAATVSLSGASVGRFR